MALINNKFEATLTDDYSTDPIVDQIVNFTDDSYDSYSINTVTINAGSSITNPNWQTDTETCLFDLTSQSRAAKYVVLVTNYPIYAWIGRKPARFDPADPGYATYAGWVKEDTVSPTPGIPGYGTPKTMIKNFMVLSGSTTQAWAINPSRDTDLPPRNVEIKIVYVYAI